MNTYAQFVAQHINAIAAPMRLRLPRPTSHIRRVAHKGKRKWSMAAIAYTQRDRNMVEMRAAFHAEFERLYPMSLGVPTVYIDPTQDVRGTGTIVTSVSNIDPTRQ